MRSLSSLFILVLVRLKDMRISYFPFARTSRTRSGLVSDRSRRSDTRIQVYKLCRFCTWSASEFHPSTVHFTKSSCALQSLFCKLFCLCGRHRQLPSSLAHTINQELRNLRHSTFVVCQSSFVIHFPSSDILNNESHTKSLDETN
jgi:hypothetical protein